MTPADRAAGLIRDLVTLMYRADWTTLSLAAEIAEFDDFSAYMRMVQPPRPSWAPRAGPHAPGRPDDRRDRRPSGAGSDEGGEDDEEEDDDFESAGSRREQSLRLLLAPGGRFRAETHSSRGRTSVRISDGQAEWDLDEGGRHGAPSLSTAVPPGQPPCAELLCPAWLPARFELELAGPAVAAGRPAYRLIGRPRPAGRDLSAGGRGPGRRGRAARSVPRAAHRAGLARAQPDLASRIDVLVDAELGILLRCERLHDGEAISAREITALSIDPPDANDTSEFTAPAGRTEPPSASPFTGPGWDRAKSAASLGATALSYAVRYGPHRKPPAGAQAGGPLIDPSAQHDWPGAPGPAEPVSAALLTLLYESGLRPAGFDAELRTWQDDTAVAERLSSAASDPALAGVRQLAREIGARTTTWQSRESVRIGLPNRYRVEFLAGGNRPPKAAIVACDGSRRWRVYPDHVSAGPARPLPPPLPLLADPSWLLDWRLTGGAEVMLDGRRGYQIRIGERWAHGPDPEAMAATPTDAVIDAELGVLLRLTREQAGRPAMQQTITAVRVRPSRPDEDFRVEVPASTRVVADTGTLLDEADAPAPVQAAAQLAGKAFKGALRIGSFLESVRRQAGPPGPGDRG
jgi:hypothetical protein